MSDELTGDVIFRVLQQDPDFIAGVPETAMPAWQSFCHGIPGLLSDLLPQRLTPRAFFGTRARIVGHIIEGSWLERTLSLYPAEMFEDQGGLREVLQRYGHALNITLTGLQLALLDPNGFLEAHGLTPELLMQHEDGCVLSAEVYRYFMEPDGLTVEELLRLEPYALIVTRAS